MSAPSLSALPTTAFFPLPDPSPSASSSVLRSRIHWVCVTNEGYIVVYLNEEHLLHSYTINGRLLATKDIKERLYAFMPSEDGQVLITGGDNCLVVFRWVHIPLHSLSALLSHRSLPLLLL
jgi:hypothetical protein